MSDERGPEPACDDGEPLDESELDPFLAMPSPRVYRGSLIALVLGSIFAVWLLVLPPVGADQDSPPTSIIGIGSTAEPSATSVATAEPTGSSVPGTASTPTPGPTVASTPVGTATATPTPATTTVTYTVVPGDTMLAIAEQFLPAGSELNAFVGEIAAANDIADVTAIQVGQVLEIPGQ